jgi:trimeric autotransporter adhesin
MFGFAGRKRVGQSADVERRSLRAGAARRARVLTATLLVLAGPIASLWVGVSPAAASVTLTQVAPTTGTTTTTASSAFTSQLNTTGQGGLTVNFVTTPATSCGVTVSVLGAISTNGTLHSGGCTVSGTDSDSGGDTGTWTYTLTINSVALTQSGSASGTVTTTGSSAFTDQLATNGPSGIVSFVTTSVACGVVVSVHGAISTTGTLHSGSCVVSGTDSDTAGDTAGTWTYTLTINLVALTQTSSVSGSTTTAASPAFTSQLATTGPSGLVSFVTTSVACGVVVSSSGAISTTGSLPVGTCVVSGTDSDIFGDTPGTWTYTLTITLVTVTQTAPTSGTTTTTASSAFTTQLATTGSGTVSFVTTSSTPCGVVVALHGAISTTGSLPVGTCTVSGTDSDTNGDTGGNWFYTLTITAVTITQTAPTSGTTTTTASSAFTGQLATTGSGTVSFATTPATACGVAVSSSGAITTTGSLAASTCTVSGTDSDTHGDTAGTWTYTLTINSVTVTPTPSTTITQGAPMTGWTTPAASAAFKAHLATTGQSGSVSFVTTSWACWVDVSSSGAITATRGLKPGHCTIRGTDSDSAGDTGTWTYTLNIGPVTITQRAPMTGWTTTAASARFKGHLAMNGRHGHVWFVTTSRSCGVAVSSSGAITTEGRLKAGHCAVWGTDTGSARTWGRWTFTLTVRR